MDYAVEEVVIPLPFFVDKKRQAFFLNEKRQAFFVNKKTRSHRVCCICLFGYLQLCNFETGPAGQIVFMSQCI